MSLVARGLMKSYKSPAGLVRALRGVDLELASGEALGLVGESGSGKSTLLRALLLLERPDEGTVHLDGTELTALDARPLRKRRRAMQLVFQDPASSLNPRMSIGAALGEARRVHALDDSKESLAALLAQVGLPAAYTSRYPHELSGGERQRVAIARALAVEPSILAADEPVSGLDREARGIVLGLFKKLERERGLASLIVTHDLTTLAETTKRAAVLYAGRIVEVGPTRTLLDAPLHPYTRALVAAAPGPGRTHLKVLEGEPPSPLAPPPGCAFSPRCALAVARCQEEAPLPHTRQAQTVACHVTVGSS